MLNAGLDQTVITDEIAPRRASFEDDRLCILQIEHLPSGDAYPLDDTFRRCKRHGDGGRDDERAHFLEKPIGYHETIGDLEITATTEFGAGRDKTVDVLVGQRRANLAEVFVVVQIPIGFCVQASQLLGFDRVENCDVTFD